MNDHAGGQPVSGRVALVIGASKGIGAATAEAFAAAGAAVVLAARDTTALKAVADGIAARGGRALAVGADVTNAGSVRDVVDQAVSVFGRAGSPAPSSSGWVTPRAGRRNSFLRPGRPSASRPRRSRPSVPAAAVAAGPPSLPKRR